MRARTPLEDGPLDGEQVELPAGAEHLLLTLVDGAWHAYGLAADGSAARLEHRGTVRALPTLHVADAVD